MKRRLLSSLCLIGMLSLSIGCGSPTIGPDKALFEKPKIGIHLVQDVPFFPQEDHYCGPAALAGLLTYYGRPTTQHEIAQAIYLPRHFGTLSMDLLLYSKAKGLDTRVVEGNLNLLKSEVDQKHPIVVFLNLGLKIFPKGHFITVIGYNDLDQTIIAHSGQDAERSIPYAQFLQAWGKTGFWTLLVNSRRPA
jgi:ABC-type bacteriocin/lantibiotic exporter with double-glycine peptidase domain